MPTPHLSFTPLKKYLLHDNDNLKKGAQLTNRPPCYTPLLDYSQGYNNLRIFTGTHTFRVGEHA